MDTNQLKELFEENKGDIIIKGKGKNKQWHVISYILKRISPVFKKMLTNDLKEKSSSIIDLSHYDNDNIDFMLKYVYYKYVITDLNMIKSPLLLCELVHIFDIYELHEPKDHLIKLMNVVKTKEFIFASLNEFPKYGVLFQNVQKYIAITLL